MRPSSTERMNNAMCFLLWYQILDCIFCCLMGSQILVDVKKSSRKAMLVKCSTFDCTFCATTDSDCFKNLHLHIRQSNFLGDHSASCFPTGTQLPFRLSILSSLPVVQSTLRTQPETSTKTLHKSLLSSSNNFWHGSRR